MISKTDVVWGVFVSLIILFEMSVFYFPYWPNDVMDCPRECNQSYSWKHWCRPAEEGYVDLTCQDSAAKCGNRTLYIHPKQQTTDKDGFPIMKTTFECK